MDDPVSTLLGITAIAVGIAMMYGAYKNKRVFGSRGVIPTALTTGKLANLDDIDEMYPSFGLSGGSLSLGSAFVDLIANTPGGQLLEKYLEWARKQIGSNETATIHFPVTDKVLQALSQMSVHEPEAAAKLAVEVARLSDNPAASTTQAHFYVDAFRNQLGKPAGEYKAQAEIVAQHLQWVTGGESF